MATMKKILKCTINQHKLFNGEFTVLNNAHISEDMQDELRKWTIELMLNTYKKMLKGEIPSSIEG